MKKSKPKHHLSNIIMFILFFLFVCTAGKTWAIDKSEVLNYLNSLKNKVISGQFVRYAYEFAKADVVENYAGTTPDPGTDSPKGDYTNSIGQTFKLIQAGTFIMGSPDDEGWSDETQHQVTLTQSYYMQTTEVTQAQWEKMMGTKPSDFSGCPDCPVEEVSWNDVQDFIEKLNQKEGTVKYRLPTEAEWEYASRAGSTTAFANGDITETGYGYDPNLDAMGWYTYNSDNKTHEVAQKQPNAWGLYDMHGNVWERVQDWYGSYPSGAVTDPEGPSSGSDRVVRGGSWFSSAGYCRSAYRYVSSPVSDFNNLGFRLLSTGVQQHPDTLR